MRGTLEATSWSFMRTNNYTDAILTAINLGGDTDTIGAITGGLAGLFYGFDNIPHDWLQYLLKREEILKQVKAFENAIQLI